MRNAIMNAEAIRNAINAYCTTHGGELYSLDGRKRVATVVDQDGAHHDIHVAKDCDESELLGTIGGIIPPVVSGGAPEEAEPTPAPVPHGWDAIEADDATTEAEAVEATTYEVIVVNIGTVYYGPSRTVADATFDSYKVDSQGGVGLAGGEDVVMMADGAIEREYNAPTPVDTIEIAEFLDGLTCQGWHDEESGEADRHGWHGLFRGVVDATTEEGWAQLSTEDQEDLLGCAGAIVRTDNDGFHYAEVYPDTPQGREALERAWDGILAMDDDGDDDSDPDDDGEPDGPDDGDWVTEDCITFREVNGRGVVVVEPWDDHRFVMMERAESDKYFPNVWYVSDHGNASILDLTIPDGTTRPTRPHAEAVESTRMDDGKLPAFAWPGGYPLYYVAKDCEAFCPSCANGENGSDCGKSNDDDWHLVGVELNYEDDSLTCVHCNARIESAYAEPEEAPTEFVDAYIKCALWASTDDDGEPLDGTYDTDDFTPEAIATITTDCNGFWNDHHAILATDAERAGADFFLNRNRHGSGFWDGHWGEHGTTLSDAAKVWGSQDLYVGDDGKIHVL